MDFLNLLSNIVHEFQITTNKLVQFKNIYIKVFDLIDEILSWDKNRDIGNDVL